MVVENGTKGVRGFLLVSVEEASGRNKSDTFVWDNNNFEGFVKAELRGGERPIRANTSKVEVKGTSLTWQEDLKLEVLEGANELRVMLCREKTSPDNKKGVVVLAACGIYVNDIIDAVPIDKYFELFKPTQGGEGGFIRIQLNFSETGDFPEKLKRGSDSRKVTSTPSRMSFQGYSPVDETAQTDVEKLPTIPEKSGAKSSNGMLKKVVIGAAVVAGLLGGARILGK